MKSSIELLKSAWEIYKRRIKTLLSISLISLVLALAVTPFSDQRPQEVDWSLETIIFGVIFGLIYIFLSIWVQTATISAIKDETLGFKSAFKESMERVPGFLWVEALVGLFTLIGLIFFVIPGFIFGVWYCLAPLVFMFEGKKGMEALRASKTYVSGNFWGVVKRWAVVGLVYFVLFLPTFILGDQSHVVSNVYSLLLGFLIAPFASAYSIELYKSLRDLKNPPQQNPTIAETNPAS